MVPIRKALAIALPALLWVTARSAMVTDNRDRVRIHAPEPECRAVQNLVRRCMDSVDDFLDLRKGPIAWLDIRVAAPDTVARHGDLVLPPDVNPLQATHRINLALLQRTARARLSASITNRAPPTSLDWLAAALTFDVLNVKNRSDGLVLPPDTTPASILFGQDRFPAIEALLSRPVSPKWPLCYTLYSLHCHLLARCVRLGDRSAPSRLARILELQARGRQGLEAVSFTMANVFRRGENLQRWYQRRAQDLARLGASRTPLPTLVARVHRLTTVPVLAPGGNGEFGHDSVPLEDLAGRLRDYKLNSQAIRSLEGEFQELLMGVPVLFIPSIEKYILAVQKIARGRRWGVRRELRKASTAFDEAVDRQRRICAYLDEVAVRAVPFDVRLGACFEALRPLPHHKWTGPSVLDQYLATSHSDGDRLGEVKSAVPGIH